MKQFGLSADLRRCRTKPGFEVVLMSVFNFAVWPVRTCGERLESADQVDGRS